MNMKRYDLIDTLRGLAVISMIAYHACFIMSYFGIAIPMDTMFSPAFMVWERSICMSFILIAGFSFSYGRHHLRSGLVIFVLGLVITAVTCIVVPDIKIIFGILTFIGTATLLMIPVDKCIRTFSNDTGESKVSGCVLLIINLVFFIFTYNINKGSVGIGSAFQIALPQKLYNGYIATFFGFMDPGFYSSDYFSVMPWIFLYLCGYFLHEIIKGTVVEEKVLIHKIPGVNVIGRHSLPIYVIHPIALFIIIWGISAILK